MQWGRSKPSGYYCALWVDILVGRKVPSMAPLVQLSVCTVMLSAILSSLLSGATSSKMANWLLLRVCPWWTGCKSWMFAGAVGSCNVVGIQVGVLVGVGSIECALAWRASPLVMGLLLAPSVPVWQAIVGVAPLVMVCQWQLDLMCLGEEQGKGCHVGS
jgi:hypothetical protein